jgi:hypothetical protein
LGFYDGHGKPALCSSAAGDVNSAVPAKLLDNQFWTAPQVAESSSGVLLREVLPSHMLQA